LAVDFSTLKGLTEFPFGLLIPQHMTERALGDILEERARETPSNGNLRFLRGLKMAGMKEEERMIDGTLQKGFLVSFEGGQNVWSRYLVGADGAKSMVGLQKF
jgi:2-polyprenyl-6-methoxyphenol hydroxylase-like FAD-dependent oxidoreductase